MQGGGRQQATDRNLAVGHVDVQLVADPDGLVALAVLLRADIAGGRQVPASPAGSWSAGPFETCQDLWPFFALLRPPPLALGRRGRLLLRGRLLTGLDGRRVAREVAHQPVVVRLPDQRFVHALGQLRVGELGKGGARRPTRSAPRTSAPSRRAGAGPHRRPTGPAVRASTAGRRPPWPRRPAPSPRGPWAAAPAPVRVPGNQALDTDDLQGLHQLLLFFGQWTQRLLQPWEQRTLDRLPVGANEGARREFMAC